MKARFWGAFVSAIALQAGVALAACAPGQNRGCVNLDGMSEISQQIVATEPLAKAVKKDAAPTVEAAKPYTGPTVGLTNTVHRAPTVGYHWSLD